MREEILSTFEDELHHHDNPNWHSRWGKNGWMYADPDHAIVTALLDSEPIELGHYQYQLHLATNRDCWTSKDWMKKQFLQLGASLNRRFGHRKTDRITALGFLEAADYSPHYHALVHIPNRIRRRMPHADLAGVVHRSANKIFPRSGSDVILRRFDTANAEDFVGYISKEEQWAFNAQPNDNPLNNLTNLVGF